MCICLHRWAHSLEANFQEANFQEANFVLACRLSIFLSVVLLLEHWALWASSTIGADHCRPLLEP